MEMRKAIRYGAILLLSAGLNQACEAQSKEETLQWIKSRLPETTATSQYDDNTVSASYSNVVINGCLLTYTEKFTNVEADIFSGGDRSTAKSVTEVAIPLDRLSSARFRSAHDTPSDELLVASAVVFESADKAIATTWTSTSQDYSEPVRTAHGSKSQSTYAIWVSDKDVAQRLVKAFSHAIELCGGKKEAF
jgi:hypothetical protein